MLQNSIKTLFFVSCLFHTVGCSTTPVRERALRRIEVCDPDPRNDALQCADKDGEMVTRPFQNIADGVYLCFPTDEITRILKSL